MTLYELRESRRSRSTAPGPVSTGVDASGSSPSSGGDPVAAVQRHPASMERPLERTAEQVFIDTLRDELDSYYVGLRTLAHLPPDQVFHWLSGVSARLVEIRAHLHRSESRRCAGLRTREVDPLLEEVDRQFKFHSRIAAMAELEWRMQGGAPA